MVVIYAALPLPWHVADRLCTRRLTKKSSLHIQQLSALHVRPAHAMNNNDDDSEYAFQLMMR